MNHETRLAQKTTRKPGSLNARKPPAAHLQPRIQDHTLEKLIREKSMTSAMEHLEHDQTSARAIPGNNGMHGKEGNSLARLSAADIPSFLSVSSFFFFSLSLAGHETQRHDMTP